MNILIIGEDKPGRGSTGFTEKHFEEIKKCVPDAKISLSLDQTEIDKLIPTIDIVITGPFHANMINLELAKNLKWVHTSSAGVTDVAKMLKDTDILLTNSSGVHPIPISEHVATFMLMFARQMTVTYKNQLDKKWIRDFGMIKVFELRGKTAGIVGYGKIGSQIAKSAKGLGMKTAALEHTKKIEDENIDKTYKDVKELLENSDFIINALPLTDKTLGYFDMAKFKFMKPTSYFINIGRGKTVVEKDLVNALKTGVIAGAGLDVFEEEPTPDTNPLWTMPNVIMTPHSSGWTPEYTNRVVDIFCRNLAAFMEKKQMPTLVDKSRGY